MFAVWPACNRDKDLPDENHWCSSVFGCRNACGLADRIDIVEVDDIISYHDLVTEEKAALQKGMNFGVGKKYSIFLMSLREGAPYADALDEVTGMLTYEGHDEPQRAGGPNPKEVDQPLTTPRGSWTENGKFFRAAMDFKSGLREKPELIKVYEKISRGIWSYKGFFELIDANIVSDGRRKVFKFSLKPVEKKSFGRIVELPHNRLIPTPVKIEVRRRDGGRCVECSSTKESTLRSRHPVFEGRQQPDSCECSIALRET
jgi:hypothetical protein